MANKQIVHYSLLPMIVQHWLNTRKLNRHNGISPYLGGYRIEKRLLNPLASKQMCKPEKTNNNNAPKYKDIESIKSAGDIKLSQQMKVQCRAKPSKVQHHYQNTGDDNECKVLA